MSEKTFRESFSLKTDDIPGARPMIKSYSFTNKVSFSNSNLGIEKSSPQSSKLLTSRVTNPLTPDYKLPSHEPRLFTPPKFIRDTLDIRDITSAKSRLPNGREVRNSLDVSDIVSPKTAAKAQKGGLNNTLSGRRLTNPLCPEYLVKGKDDVLVTIGEIPGSKPKVLINVRTPPHDRSLNVKDIQGGSVLNSTTATFRTPKLKLKDLMNGFSSRVLLKPSSFSGANSPNSIDSGVSSISGLSLQSSPVSVSSKTIPNHVNRVKKASPNLPKSPSSTLIKKPSRWK